MKRVALLLTTASIALVAAVPASAQAKCGLGCLNGKINSLSNQVSSLNGQVSSLNGQVSSLSGQLATANAALGKLNGCIKEAPVSDYGDSAGTFGYVFSNDGVSSFFTSALDETAPGDIVSGWLLLDGCNTQIIAGTAHAAHVTGALGPEQSLPGQKFPGR